MTWILLISILLAPAWHASGSEWGFFGHKLANRLAVFTLPPELIGFYKTNIGYIEDHAVDADKRRYATMHEAVRHYIDLDRSDGLSPDSLSRSWAGAIAQHLQIVCIQHGDSTSVVLDSVDSRKKEQFVRSVVLPVYYDEHWPIEKDSISSILGINCETCEKVKVSESLSAHGILPWHLVHIQRRLTSAFRTGDIPRVLRLSADIGHYIGDAHVPLHTSENYNGQLTGQEGIHAFWESRIPELFYEQYDFFVGRASYIEDPVKFYWDIVLESHSMVDSVLMIESKLTAKEGLDQKYCFDQRGNTIVRTYCEEFARQFESALNGMVERRLRASIHSIGSAWYTAWIDAGKPSLRSSGYIVSENELYELNALESAFKTGRVKGRPH